MMIEIALVVLTGVCWLMHRRITAIEDASHESASQETASSLFGFNMPNEKSDPPVYYEDGSAEDGCGESDRRSDRRERRSILWRSGLRLSNRRERPSKRRAR